MGTTVIFVGQWKVTDCESCWDYWISRAAQRFQEIASTSVRTLTDTGGQVEYTKALERMTLKELGNLPSVTSG